MLSWTWINSSLVIVQLSALLEAESLMRLALSSMPLQKSRFLAHAF